VCLITSPSAAQETPRPDLPVVVVVQTPRHDSGALIRALSAAWSRRGAELVPVPPSPELERPDVASLASARRAFAELRPQEAVVALEEFVARVDALGGGVGPETWISALLLLGRAQLALGDPARATEAFDRVLSVAPDIHLDEARYPPPLREALEARRVETQPHADLTLQFDHAPPGLSVSVDGAPAVAPGDLPTLAPGLHVLRLTAPDRRPRALRVEVSPDQTHVDATLADDPFAPLRSEERALPSPRDLRVAAARLGAVPLALQLRPAASGRLHVELWAAAEDLRAAVDVADSETPHEIVRQVVLAFGRVESRPERQSRRRVRIIVGASAVVATLAAALTLVLTRHPDSGFRLQLESGLP